MIALQTALFAALVVTAAPKTAAPATPAPAAAPAPAVKALKTFDEAPAHLATLIRLNGVVALRVHDRDGTAGVWLEPLAQRLLGGIAQGGKLVAIVAQNEREEIIRGISEAYADAGENDPIPAANFGPSEALVVLRSKVEGKQTLVELDVRDVISGNAIAKITAPKPDVVAEKKPVDTVATALVAEAKRTGTATPRWIVVAPTAKNKAADVGGQLGKALGAGKTGDPLFVLTRALGDSATAITVAKANGIVVYSVAVANP
ncbi:MAG: hypothetical protein IT381_01490 [Deltaproteobacteria bacterium]|nr:hypothetical protein [Deltaproteobacteria bacterium]